MLKYDQMKILLAEIPDEISLGISLVGCPRHCEGCHSPNLWDTADNSNFKKLTAFEIDSFLTRNRLARLTCVLFLGGEWDLNALISLTMHAKEKCDLRVGLYTGANLDDLRGHSELIKNLDYLKVGEFRKDLGGLTSRSTNQKLFKLKDNSFLDITYKFWR